MILLDLLGVLPMDLPFQWRLYFNPLGVGRWSHQGFGVSLWAEWCWPFRDYELLTPPQPKDTPRKLTYVLSPKGFTFS